MNKKIRILLITIMILIAGLTTKVEAAYSAEVTLSSENKLEAGKNVEVTLKLENINATATGVSVVKGKIEYDTEVFESYTVETKNGWKSENNNNTFLFEKETGVTANEEVAVVKFKVKESISKTSGEIKFTNITVSGIVQSSGGPGDIKVAGTTLKITQTEAPKITKEIVIGETGGAGATSTTAGGKMPYAGADEAMLIGIVMFSITGGIMYKRYRNIDR